jgi:hypothetical protein
LGRFACFHLETGSPARKRRAGRRADWAAESKTGRRARDAGDSGLYHCRRKLPHTASSEVDQIVEVLDSGSRTDARSSISGIFFYALCVLSQPEHFLGVACFLCLIGGTIEFTGL